MSKRNRLLQAIDELETTLRQSAGLADGNLDDRRQEGIRFRRLLSEQIGRISSLGEHAFEERTAQAEFRGQFSKMRSAMALHQASWPIVAIDLENPEYLASVRSMRVANRDFIAWVRSALASS